MKQRGNLLKGESRFVDAPTITDYLRIENINMGDVCRLTNLSENDVLSMYSSNLHLFYIVCVGCRHIKAISK